MIDSEVMVGTGFKISVSREAFVDSLTLVSRAVSTRTAVLVLGGVQLRSDNGQLHLAATDMELSLRTSLEADVSGEGEAVVPGRLLLDIARSLPDADVSIEHLAGESVGSVTRGSASDRNHTYPAEDFPRLPRSDSASRPPVRTHALP